jgi:hypothetical protein
VFLAFTNCLHGLNGVYVKMRSFVCLLQYKVTGRSGRICPATRCRHLEVLNRHAAADKSQFISVQFQTRQIFCT